jgi:hypothetical protein
VDDGLEHTRSNLLAELMSATILAQDSPTVSAKLGTAALRVDARPSWEAGGGGPEATGGD